MNSILIIRTNGLVANDENKRQDIWVINEDYLRTLA
jgi:hypothetical protein